MGDSVDREPTGIGVKVLGGEKHLVVGGDVSIAHRHALPELVIDSGYPRMDFARRTRWPACGVGRAARAERVHG